MAVVFVIFGGVSCAGSDEPKVAPDFTLEDLSGTTRSLGDYKGEVVFLNFWAVGCKPCREEMPNIENLHRSMKDKPFKVLAVNLGESKGIIRSFMAGRYTIPVLMDNNGKAFRAYGGRYIPTTFIIDKNGFIRHKLIGAAEWDGEEYKDLFYELMEE
ncbi:MAG: hypothetical protein AUJ75_00920 [Candidatus Omnitrophica bacterium CG1_02_49_10]|nr:MAG: hypothetical protein AUJ75_00920 [Candidatus Omnitrophica bacterium CG1_02_49_10]